MAPTPWKTNQYPPTRRSDHINVYKSEKQGEVRVHDPYQWLEQNTEETDKWTTAQAEFTSAYLEQNPDRQKLEDAIRANTNYAKFSAPGLKDDGRWYWFYNSGLQAQPVLYRSQSDALPDFTTDDGPGGEVFFDPNVLTSDGTAALADHAFSRDGKYFAYAISVSGSDVTTVYVRPTSAPLAKEADAQPGEHGRLSDEVHFVKFSRIVWTHDSKGFFYQRFPNVAVDATNNDAGIETSGDQNAMLFYHRVGTPQDKDVLVIKDPENPTYMWAVGIAETDGRYLELYISRDTSRKNQLWICDLQENEIGPNMVWDKVISDFTGAYGVIANDGTKFYLKTNDNAPQYRVVTVDLADKTREHKVLIPEDKSAFLADVSAVDDDKFAVVYKRDVKDEIYVYSNTGARLARVAPDFVGAATLSTRRAHTWFFATLTGFTSPGTVARYDFAVGDEEKRWSTYRKTQVKGLDLDDFEAKQVWYESKDGTKVPMFIVWHKSTKLDGTAPALQYGYGGFSISIDPFFSPSFLTFLQKYGGVLAVPNIRGGSEFGEDWHQAGTRERKVNVFDDFIAATEYLVANKYAAKGKVAINGGSNGGLLVAACVNRAPEGTFGAAVAEVGVMDLLKFADFTIGKAWTSDYGDPHDPHDFDFIYPISPLHNIPQDKVLPPTILLTADHDDRVVPMHSFKLAAELQHALPHNPHPLLLRVDKKAGHGAGKSTEKRIKDAADKLGFVAQSLGLVWRDVE